MKLNKSQVLFDEIEHTYTYNGRRLSGITPIIGSMLFPDKYDCVPASVLATAAQRGHEIHKALEDFVNGDGLMICPELESFVELFQRKNIVPMAAEYIVSDNTRIATAIDMVDQSLNLYDYKTTSTLDKEYVSWQLSVGAWLFELQNPGLTAGRLYAIHYKKGVARPVRVERKPIAMCEGLITAYFTGGEFTYNQISASAIINDIDLMSVRIEDIRRSLQVQGMSHEYIKQQIINAMR